jgi:hypothetical protein
MFANTNFQSRLDELASQPCAKNFGPYASGVDVD